MAAGKFRTTFQGNLLITVTATGLPGALAEIAIRGGDTLPQSFFKRVCKRNAVGNLELRTALRQLEWVAERDDFPMALDAPKLVWDTFRGWKSYGRGVRRGESSIARGSALSGHYNVAVFNSLQVKRYDESNVLGV